ncbi:tetratricopeptide repeat domain-containing protein [Dunaliella salina]|uniref:Tetratricopeptide repeat domain-containing protein n=1 Tax=Dunaliella salina TaxID=3046 RepID=A0ABQ7GWV3_DUNSA|nr:tetratricopeptide repeat domain-containing protein [Dunaliella salina]|eukprot:KAF5839087.1 tetratricopeptide repeat domain-containing protein [Dunaliella salina]
MKVEEATQPGTVDSDQQQCSTASPPSTQYSSRAQPHREQQEEGSSSACDGAEAKGQTSSSHEVKEGDRQVAEPTAEPTPVLSEEQQAEMLAASEALKAEGNTLYAQQDYHGAANKYADAVEAAPPPPYARKQRAIYLANLAACDIARGDNAEALRACSAAIEEDPSYIKAYARRFNAFEALDDLDRALADAKKVLEMDPSNTWASVSVRRLEPIVKERHEKLKNDMMGKFKELGNTLLGKFGMSLDNFKAEQDPNTGGYSIKFQQ